MQPSGHQMQNSLEMSLWSLDVSMPSGMESSIFETEVFTEICTYIVTVLPPCIYSTYMYIQCESTLPYPYPNLPHPTFIHNITYMLKVE